MHPFALARFRITPNSPVAEDPEQDDPDGHPSVGNRQSPGNEPSVRPHCPCARFAASLFASAQFLVLKQFAFFNQYRPVTVSLIVPSPQSTKRFPVLSKQVSGGRVHDTGPGGGSRLPACVETKTMELIASTK